MIKFKQVSYCNFLSNGDQPQIISLDHYITSLFTGKNGSGKSTFIDAIVYTLFGKPYRKVRLGQLINNVNEKGLLCEVEFTIGKKHYLVKRGMQPSVFEIYVDGEMIEQPAKTSDYQEILENDILKLNYKTFTQIIILASASFVPFMQLKLGDRREVIENLLDISVFTKMNVLLKEKIKITKEEIKDIKHQIELTKERHKSKRQYMAEATEQYDERLKDLEDKIKVINNLLVTNDSVLDKLKTDKIVVEAAIEQYGDLEEKVVESSREIERLNRELYELNNDFESRKSDNEAIELIDKRIDVNKKQLSTEKKKWDDLHVLMGEQEVILNGIGSTDGRDELLTEITTITNKKLHAEKRLQFYEKNDDCPECAQGIDPEFKKFTMDDLKDDIKWAEDDFNKKKKQIYDIERNIQAKEQIESTIQDIRSSMVEVKNLIDRLESENNNLEETKHDRVHTTPEEMTIIRGEIAKLQDSIILAKDLHEGMKVDNEALTTKKKELNVIEKDIALCENTIGNDTVQANTLYEELKEHNNKPASTITQEEIDQLAQDIKDLDGQLSKKDNNLHYFGIVQRLLKDDGLKTKIIKNFLPVINATVNKYLDKFNFPINFNFDENFNETIQSNHRRDFCYYSFSEGEKARIDLALLFTWREVALKKSRNATNLIIFDEIFDGSLDVDGIENFMSILGLDNYNSFIISHNDETKNSRFDRQVSFEKHGHFSKMMETL